MTSVSKSINEELNKMISHLKSLQYSQIKTEDNKYEMRGISINYRKIDINVDADCLDFSKLEKEDIRLSERQEVDNDKINLTKIKNHYPDKSFILLEQTEDGFMFYDGEKVSKNDLNTAICWEKIKEYILKHEKHKQ